MSGILGIINKQRRPGMAPMLSALTETMRFRGPDHLATHCTETVGLGCAAFFPDADRTVQPLTLDGNVWVVADARIDDQRRLRGELGVGGAELIPDIALILRAYEKWGEQCLDHLLGDFTFILWDDRAGKLFCARDHFGLKPLYFHDGPDWLIVSNTLETIRRHPAVRDELNEGAIADFLLFDSNQDPATTTFLDIQRVPAAHQLTWSVGDGVVRRYWQLPIREMLRISVPEARERFEVVMGDAVADRIRGSRAGISLSGGLDSAVVAMFARRRFPGADLKGFTTVYEHLIPDEEGRYSAMTARALGMEHSIRAADSWELLEGIDHPRAIMPEPVTCPFPRGWIESTQALSAEGRIMLTGLGGDPLLRGTQWMDAVRKGRWDILWMGLKHAVQTGGFPQLGLRGWVRTRVGPNPLRLPEWIDPGFAREMGIQERWKRGTRPPYSAHPVRPASYARISVPFWTLGFDAGDSGTVGIPLSNGHPFFDIRLVDLLESFPPFPHFDNKRLIRDVLAGSVPEAIWRRPKIALQGFPYCSVMARQASRDNLENVPWTRLQRYCVEEKPGVPRIPPPVWEKVRRASLAFWLAKKPRIDKIGL